MQATKYTMVVVDESHHLYRDEEARDIISPLVGEGTRLLLLSDVSQSLGDQVDFPPGLTEVVLTEVVRNSKRIVQAASSFQLGGEAKLETMCHHESDGPPLRSYLFDVPDERARFATYAERTALALADDVISRFPGLQLQGRLAILVPDADFLAALRPELVSALHARFGSRFALIDASEASAMLLERYGANGSGRVDGGVEQLVLDTLPK